MPEGVLDSSNMVVGHHMYPQREEQRVTNAQKMRVDERRD